MKIQEVTIEGYQSHTNSTFRLSPGLTVITGPSDVGKTAIIRALRWFAFNEPTGEAFLHTIRNPDGSVKEAVDQVKVSVTFDNGITITKTRRKGNACCRTLTFKLSLYGNRLDLLAHKVELFYKGKRWFIGEIKKQKEEHDGTNSITAYDPLFLFGKHEDDYYFKNQTATQIIKSMAKKIGLKVYKLENTNVVISHVLYKKGAPDKITVDVLARTWNSGGDKFWFRYDPVNNGILLKRRTVPEMIWAFKTGGNLISASRERSIEEMYNTVKLINRETGKTATKVNAKNKALYGNTQYYEEISDKDKNLSKMAKQKLKSLSKITSTMSMSGLNSDGAMGQFFVGDPIYVEEKNTGMVGGYWVRNVSHTFLADDAIQLDFDLTATEDIPEIQYDNSKK